MKEENVAGPSYKFKLSYRALGMHRLATQAKLLIQ